MMRSSKWRRSRWCAVAFAVAPAIAWARDETISVDVRLRTGGSLSGLVVADTDHGLVVVHDKTPYVFAWVELEAGSAYTTKRTLLILDRGGVSKLTAEDHFQLGLFALKQGRNDLAVGAFRVAEKRNARYKRRVVNALEEARHKRRGHGDAGPLATPDKLERDASDGPTISREDLAKGSGEMGRPLADVAAGILANQPSQEVRAKLLEAYRTFGEKVREVLGRDIVLIESEHFLIWTDWRRRERDRLPVWCEAMYRSLCEQFGLDPSQNVFAAKCPVFCFRTAGRFRKFAQKFDGYSGKQAVGYTRSIERNGHVHMALVRQGRSEIDLDRFATTLVHEGSHAFLHRLYSPTLIPHWVNEGFAELVAQRVLGDRCVTAANAELLARQFVRYDWPIGDLLESSGPVAVCQYPIAHSVVAYLEGLGSDRFTAFIRILKEGVTVSDALAENYGGMTLAILEQRWREAVSARQGAGG